MNLKRHPTQHTYLIASRYHAREGTPESEYQLTRAENMLINWGTARARAHPIEPTAQLILRVLGNALRGIYFSSTELRYRLIDLCLLFTVSKDEEGSRDQSASFS